MSCRSPYLLAWLLLGPALLLLGAVLGQVVLRSVGPPAVWREPAQSHGVAAPGGAGAAASAPGPVGLPSLAPIVRQVRSGVVGIRTIRRPDAAEPLATGVAGERSRGVVNGTGFIIHESGLVVTNHHIVAGHEHIVVEVPGFRAVAAELVGVDPVTDVAVVRFEPPPGGGGLTALPLGDSSKIEQGDWVLAVGNPFEYRQTVTVGVVSYVGRHIPEEGLAVSNEYLQFSAPVNPGSSGGPVVDMAGNVVGVTTSAHAGGSGISFAVPSKVLKWVLRTMDRSDGRVRRGFLGIQLQPVDPAVSGGLDLPVGLGALVRNVEAGKPAHRAGVRAGDVIVSYNQREVPDAYSLFDWITYSEPGSTASIEVLRDGERLQPFEARLAEVAYPGEEAESDHKAEPSQ